MKGPPIKPSSDFSVENLQAMREWNDMLKLWKHKNCQPRILYPTKLSFRYEGKMKAFPDKKELREFKSPDLPYKKCWRELFKLK